MLPLPLHYQPYPFSDPVSCPRYNMSEDKESAVAVGTSKHLVVAGGEEAVPPCSVLAWAVPGDAYAGMRHLKPFCLRCLTLSSIA